LQKGIGGTLKEVDCVDGAGNMSTECEMRSITF